MSVGIGSNGVALTPRNIITISTHNGSKVARQHNLRNPKVVGKEPHIMAELPHEVWHDERPQDAYERLFGASQERYNERQTRADRRVTNYYKDICNDAKKHSVYEMIIGIYGRDDNGMAMCPAETGKQIMREFVDGWQERNPNMELIGAYYHADEQGDAHVHIDYIPVAHGYKTGMDTQNGLVRGLGEMGFHKQGKATAQIQWEARENAVLDELCREHGLEVSHPREEGRKHVETETFKAQAELGRIVGDYMELDAINTQLRQLADTSTKDFKTDRRGNVKISGEEYKMLLQAAQQVSYNTSYKSEAQRQLRQAEELRAECEQMRDNMEELILRQAEELVDDREERMKEFMQQYSINGQNMYDVFQQQEQEQLQQLREEFDGQELSD